MVKFLLKKSYSRKDLKEREFKDLWNAHGVFTTMWIYGKPQKILFFEAVIADNVDHCSMGGRFYVTFGSNTK